MAKPTPASAAAPVPDPDSGAAAEGVAAPKRFRLPRLPLRIALSRKMLIVGAAALFGVGAAGGAVYLLWPKPEEWPRQPLPKIEPAQAASAPLEVAEAELPAASQPAAAASEVADVPSAAASEPENPMDKLRRRLGETLGDGGRIEDDGPGELRLTTRRPANPVAAAATGASTVRLAAADDTADATPPRRHQPAAAHWTYQGATGPEVWGRLKPEFAKCATGRRQSPIDLHDGIRVELEPVRFDYRPSAFRVVDNGHTVQVNVAPGNHIEVLGRRYELQQFHFHRPSEERIAGRQFDMDAHLVHKDGEGRLAVVAVLLERGAAQPVVQTVWNNLPLEKGEEQAARVSIDLNELLPADRGYFIYMGSLTTPPCSEGVVWMVMKTPVGISADQLGIFSRLYPMNARPIQPAGARIVKESN